MSDNIFDLGTIYRLLPGEEARERGFLQLRRRGQGELSAVFWLPAEAQLNLLVRTANRSTRIAMSSREDVCALLNPIQAAIASLRLTFTSLRRSQLMFGDVAIFPEGGKRLTRLFRKQVRMSRRWGIALDGDLVREHPELVEGWVAGELRRPAPIVDSAAPRTAVVAHLHYIELWPEIEMLLSRWSFAFDLIVTLTMANADLEARISDTFPTVRVRVVENKGRDVRPFLALLEDSWLDGYDVVCKIHGKRALGGGRIALFGDVMRRAAFLELVADLEQVAHIVADFASDPRLGLVGPERFRSASTQQSPQDIFGPSRAQARGLAQDMGNPLADNEADFFEGTMFWVRPAALAPLRKLGLAKSSFGPESGSLDGALEHAVERVFNHAVRTAGFTVASVNIETRDYAKSAGSVGVTRGRR